MKRLKEPSTWAGIATLLQMIAPFVPPPYGIVISALTAAAGAAAVGLHEKGDLPPPVVNVINTNGPA